MKFEMSEQHVDLHEANRLRDNCDVSKLTEWFTLHYPLPQSHELMSISTGVIGNDTINCDATVAIGTTSMNKLVGKTFGEVTLHRKDRVLPLAAVNNSVKIRQETVPINTMHLFSRIICVAKSDEDFASYLEFELAPRPLSLFDQISMRRTDKTVMYQVVKSFCGCVSGSGYPQSSMFVVDGGYLLHRVIWPQHATCRDLYKAYVCYVQKHFCAGCYVIFDGYSNGPSTKGVEQERRAMEVRSSDIEFAEDMPVAVRQECFFANEKNKARFIRALADHMEMAGIEVKQAPADADTVIVRTAIDLSPTIDVVVVGTDVDLLILLLQLSPSDNHLYMFKPGSGKYPNEVYDITDIKSNMRGLCNCLQFLHAMTCSDTTSALYR